MIEGDYRIESGFRAGHALLSHRPDGIYVANHLMTIGLLKAAEEMGLRCPEDFGFVSFDDYPWLGVFRPRLTTVELPKHQLGSEAAELLIRRIAGDRSCCSCQEIATRTSHSRILRFCAECIARPSARRKLAERASRNLVGLPALPAGTPKRRRLYDSLKSISFGRIVKPRVL